LLQRALIDRSAADRFDAALRSPSC